MKNKFTLLAAVTICLLAMAHAEDWPQFRGPGRDGVWNEKGIAQSFPAAGLKVSWRAAVGSGLSSPIVSGGRVFVCDAETKNPKARERMRCFDEISGKELWTHSDEVTYPEWAFDPKTPSGPDDTPVASGGKVYYMGKMAGLLCLDVLDGKVLWRKDLTKDYELAEFSGTTPSPLVEGGLLILVIGGKPGACVVALDKDTGKEVWRALEDKWTYSSPIVLDAGGKRQLIVLTPDAVTSLDPATGKTWWREKRDLRGDFTAAGPVFDHNLLLAGGTMFHLAADKPAATVLWPDENTSYTRRILSQTSVPLIRNGCVFSDKSYGHLICLEALTGKQLWKNDELTDKANGAAQQLYPNGDSILVFTNQGNLIRATMNREGCKELSRVHVIEPTYQFAGRKIVWPLPAFANKHIFARNDKELVSASLEITP